MSVVVVFMQRYCTSEPAEADSTRRVESYGSWLSDIWETSPRVWAVTFLLATTSCPRPLQLHGFSMFSGKVKHPCLANPSE
jgi:hypothetical protein